MMRSTHRRRALAPLAAALLELLGAPGEAADAHAGEGAPESLPAATLLEVHPDGARLISTLDAGPGSRRIAVPQRSGARWRVLGAEAWSVLRGPAAAAPQRLPDALVALLDARNHLVAQLHAQAAGQAELDQLQAAFSRTLPRLARTSAPDAKEWQASLDALLLARQDLDAHGEDLEAERARVITAAASAMPMPECAAALLGLDGSDPPLVLDAQELASRWQGLPPATASETLRIAAAASASVAIAEERADVRWSPRSRIVIDGAQARLERAAHIDKPRGLDLGSIAVLATTEPLCTRLAAPEKPFLTLACEPASRAERRAVVTGSQEVELATSDSESVAAGAAAGAPVASLLPTPAAPAHARAKIAVDTQTVLLNKEQEITDGQPADLPATAARADGQHPQRWPLPPIALPAGVAEASAALDPLPLTVLADEWALIPDLAPVAMRRMTLRADAGVPGGPVELAVDGEARARQALPATAPGGLLQLRLAEDTSIMVGAESAWEVDPAEQTPRHQRQGHDRWIWNLGPAARTIHVYATVPVSHSEGIAVAVDPATTPGYEVVEPGVLRWNLMLATGAPTRLGVGWRLSASEGLHL